MVIEEEGGTGVEPRETPTNQPTNIHVRPPSHFLTVVAAAMQILRYTSERM